MRAPRYLHLLTLLAFTASLIAFNADAWSNGQAAVLVFGQTDFSTGGFPTPRNSLALPFGITTDPASGKVFVADADHDRVVRFASVAALSGGMAPDGVFGQPNIGSHVYGTARNRMRGPMNLAIDSAGRLWVVDSGNSRVLRFDNAANRPNGAPADGVLGQPDFTSVSTVTSQDRLNTPQGLTLNGNGQLWVADTKNQRVLLFVDSPLVMISAAASSPTDAPMVIFTVEFSMPVTGLGATNFVLTSGGGISGAGIVEVSGGDRIWVVKASTGAGSGTLRLDMVNSDGVQAGTGKPVQNVPYLDGAVYTITSADPPTSARYYAALPVITR